MKNFRLLSCGFCSATATFLLVQCGWENYQVSQLIDQGAQFDATHFFSCSFIRLSVGVLFGLAGLAMAHVQRH
jgi:hypothetical protein